MSKQVDLSINFCGKQMINPFMLSSSPVSNTAEMVDRAFQAGWGGVVYKTVATDRIRMVHPSPRMSSYDHEGRRVTGLQNVEVVSDRRLNDNLAELKWLKKNWPDRNIIASIMGFENSEWGELAQMCTEAGAHMLELNFSCPHMTVEGAGHKVGQAVHLVQKFTETVRKNTSLPLIAKMTPNITDINEPAMFAKQGGANAISAINTVRAVSGIGLNDWVPRPNVAGKSSACGFSGPAVRPIGLRFVADLAQNKELGLPISGIGGIETWIDALEYLLVGATTLQVTTGIIHYGYRIIEDIVEGLTDYMRSKNITDINDLVGKALVNLTDPSHFDLKKQGIAEYNLERCVGCGQCYTVCKDAGGQALEWDGDKRRPKLTEDKCLSCMICSFVCPINGLIRYKSMPETWKRTEPPRSK